jgi:hypothetical protein
MILAAFSLLNACKTDSIERAMPLGSGWQWASINAEMPRARFVCFCAGNPADKRTRSEMPMGGNTVKA